MCELYDLKTCSTGLLEGDSITPDFPFKRIMEHEEAAMNHVRKTLSEERLDYLSPTMFTHLD